jgi:hypothetical protein
VRPLCHTLSNAFDISQKNEQKLLFFYLGMYTQRKKLSAPRYIKTRIGYSTIETKEAARIGYSGFLFQHEYSGEGRGT